MPHRTVAQESDPVRRRLVRRIDLAHGRRFGLRRPPTPSARATRIAERTILSAITVTVTVAPLTMSTAGRADGASWLMFSTSRPT